MDVPVKIHTIPNGEIYLQPLNLGEAGKVRQADQLKAMSKEIHNIIENKVK